jgi:hypothetical protein
LKITSSTSFEKEHFGLITLMTPLRPRPNNEHIHHEKKLPAEYSKTVAANDSLPPGFFSPMPRHPWIDLKEQRISHAFPRAAGGFSAAGRTFANPRVHPPGTAEDGGAANGFITAFSRLISAWVT